MPTCRKCNTVFPYRIWITGILKNMQHRKYCLTCSPFGSHNTRKLEYPAKRGLPEQKICILCKRTFITKNRSSRCGICRKNKRIAFNKNRAIEMFGMACQVCGYKRCRRSFALHHVFPKTKSFGLSLCWHLRWSRLVEELKKCILVCHNCHDEIHDGLVSQETVLSIFENNKKLFYENDQDTFPSRIPKTQTCSCGKVFNGNGKYCSQECSHMAQRRTQWPSKENLKCEIENGTPFLRLAKIYKVSDNAVRKWAENYGLTWESRYGVKAISRRRTNQTSVLALGANEMAPARE
jgi:hypothetical protein